MAATLSRGDVRLCRFPPPDKQRPVLVLTRASAIGHLATVTVAPPASLSLAPSESAPPLMLTIVPACVPFNVVVPVVTVTVPAPKFAATVPPWSA